MARSDINAVATDLTPADNPILWSLISGEQMEQEVVVDFLTSVTDYSFAAVIVEALNDPEVDGIPSDIRRGGVLTPLTVRIPPYKGAWASGVYTREDVISYNGKFYKLSGVVNYASNASPDTDPHWVEYIPNKVYIQFPSTLGTDWAVKPSAVVPVHGFFELKVSEPGSAIFPRIWKPARGVVELLFSPTSMLA